ncbi:MAG TPA: hypothetical protein VIH61_10455, partial [Waddliaceae bacterium]
CQNIISQIDTQQSKFGSTVRSALEIFRDPSENSTEIKLARIRIHLTAFCSNNQDKLKPSFWNRFFTQKISKPSSEFGETYLSLAEELIEARKPNENENDAKIISYFRSAAKVYQSLLASYQIRLVRSFIDFDSSLNISDDQVLKTKLSLAKRECSFDKYQSANTFFRQVAKRNRNLFTPETTLLWLEAELEEANNMNQAKELINQLGLQPLDATLKLRYVNACIKSANYFFSKNAFMSNSPSVDDLATAMDHYKKAYINAEPNQKGPFIKGISNHVNPNNMTITNAVMGLMESLNLDPESTQNYADACEKLGFHFFKKREGLWSILTKPGSEKSNFQIALEYYKEALNKADQKKRNEIVERILSNVDVKKLEEAAALISMISAVTLDEESSKRYAEACIKVGEVCFAKRKELSVRINTFFSIGKVTTKSYCEMAIDYYKIALDRVSSDRRKEVLSRMLIISKEIKGSGVTKLVSDHGSAMMMQEQDKQAAAQLFFSLYTHRDLLTSEETDDCISKLIYVIDQVDSEARIELVRQIFNCTKEKYPNAFYETATGVNCKRELIVTINKVDSEKRKKLIHFLLLDSPQKKMSLDNKIKGFIDLAAILLNYQEFLASAWWIYFVLFEIRRNIYIFPEGQQCMSMLLEALAKLYVSNKDLKEGITLVTYACSNLTKYINELVKLTEPFIDINRFDDTPEIEIKNQAIVKDVKAKNPVFNVDMGAGLHFLYAEIIRLQEGHINDIANYQYRRAADLAPRNPFGVGSMFM